MFVLKSTHQELVKRLEESHMSEVYRLESRISDLKDQIKDLRALVFPAAPQAVEPMVMEADSVITGSEKPFEISEEEHSKLLQLAREQDLLVSGNYDEDLI